MKDRTETEMKTEMEMTQPIPESQQEQDPTLPLETEAQEPQEPVSTEARERGAIVLEVLAGTLQPGEAAEQLGINPPAYYNLETRALQGLVRACQNSPKWRDASYRRQIRDLEESNRKLEREVRRYQSLTRAAQKAIGVMQVGDSEPRSAVKTEPAGHGKRTPKKVRAQRAAERLRGQGRKQTRPKVKQSLQKAGAQ